MAPRPGQPKYNAKKAAEKLADEMRRFRGADAWVQPSSEGYEVWVRDPKDGLKVIEVFAR